MSKIITTDELSKILVKLQNIDDRLRAVEKMLEKQQKDLDYILRWWKVVFFLAVIGAAAAVGNGVAAAVIKAIAP